MIFGKATNGSNPEVVQSPFGGTGPMMLMKALGIDPAAMTGKLGEFEAMFKTAMNTLVERSQSIDQSLAAINEKLREKEERADKNLESLTAALSDISVHLQCIENLAVQNGPGPGTRAEGKPKRNKVN